MRPAERILKTMDEECIMYLLELIEEYLDSVFEDFEERLETLHDLVLRQGIMIENLLEKRGVEGANKA